MKYIKYILLIALLLSSCSKRAYTTKVVILNQYEMNTQFSTRDSVWLVPYDSTKVEVSKLIMSGKFKQKKTLLDRISYGPGYYYYHNYHYPYHYWY